MTAFSCYNGGQDFSMAAIIWLAGSEGAFAKLTMIIYKKE